MSSGSLGILLLFRSRLLKKSSKMVIWKLKSICQKHYARVRYFTQDFHSFVEFSIFVFLGGIEEAVVMTCVVLIPLEMGIVLLETVDIDSFSPYKYSMAVISSEDNDVIFS